MWDLDTGTLLHTLTGHAGGVWAVAVSADGRRAVSGDDKTVRMWNLATGKQIAPNRPMFWSLRRRHRVGSLSISADGRRAVSGGGDGTVRMWDLGQGAKLASFVSGNAITVMAATPAGARAVADTSVGLMQLLELCGQE